ncbi:MAG TPA: helix-turn-helix transcriptional regulator [Rudaea sp.]|nr:helix-turn-helix transcriptional regulator [Rudaea sp.]
MAPPSRRSTDRRFSGTLADRVRHARRIAGLSQSAMAKQVGVVPSAVAQWEGSSKTSPTVEHLIRIAQSCNVAFEWLASGRGETLVIDKEVPAIDPVTIAQDMLEERLLIAFRRMTTKKREAFVSWLETFV